MSNIKVQPDGKAFLATGDAFTDLASSNDFAYGDTAEEAEANYVGQAVSACCGSKVTGGTCGLCKEVAVLEIL